MKCQRCFEVLGLDIPEPSCPRCEGTGETCRVCNGQGYVYVATDRGISPCSCGLAARNAARSPGAQQMIQQLSILSGRLKDCGFGNFSVSGTASLAKSALAATVKWATSPVGWLVICGPMGAGKTHLAAAAANNLATSHVVLITSVPVMLDWLREVFKYRDSDDTLFSRLEFIKVIPVLILDDLGAEYHKTTSDDGMDWAGEKLYAILDHRYREGLPTMITTNVSSPNQIEPRIRDRIFSNEWSVVMNNAPSWRTGQIAIGERRK